MDRDTDLFVQAFWAKCREVIRPEIDDAIGELHKAGHDAGVSTREYSATPDQLPAAMGPSVTVSLRPKGAADKSHPTLQFRGDVADCTVEVRSSTGILKKYELNTVNAAEVRNEIDEWLAKLIA